MIGILFSCSNDDDQDLISFQSDMEMHGWEVNINRRHHRHLNQH